MFHRAILYTTDLLYHLVCVSPACAFEGGLLSGSSLAVLRQDVSFFDTHESSGDLTTGINVDTYLVQQAIGEKVINLPIMLPFR